MRFSKEERQSVNWGALYGVACPYCDAQPTKQCIRKAREGYQYRTWEWHTARKDAAILARMFIIPEEADAADLVLT
ncbi:MAG TPA: hypothetical protein VFH56_02925 [Acidimicrobiales bacterium]|nr:hypothetical protein [Acidimicrobiales bacterium]